MCVPLEVLLLCSHLYEIEHSNPINSGPRSNSNILPLTSYLLKTFLSCSFPFNRQLRITHFFLKLLFYCAKNICHEIYPLYKFLRVQFSTADRRYIVVQHTSRLLILLDWNFTPAGKEFYISPTNYLAHQTRAPSPPFLQGKKLDFIKIQTSIHQKKPPWD